MKLNRILALAFNSVIHSKLRSWLTIIGIIIGIGSFITIFAIGNGMEKNINERLSSFQLDVINISPGFSRAISNFGPGGGPGGMPSSQSSDINLTIKDVFALKSINEIAVISKEISGQEKIYYTGESIKKNITAVDVVNWLQITNITLDSGRLLTTSDKYSVLIGDMFATNSFTKEIPLNIIIIINNKSYRVVGIIDNSNDIIIPMESANGTFTDVVITNFDKITVKVKSDANVDNVVNKINTKLMASRHVNNKTKDFSVSAVKDTASSMSEMTNSMTLFLTIVSIISLIVGAIGVANTMFTSVLEKTKEIGIMKSIGASNSDILFLFVLIAVLYGIVGGIIGVLVGGALSGVMGNVLGFSAGVGRGGMGGFLASGSVTLSLAIYGVLLSIGICVLSGFIPAYRASKLKPVKALRYE